MAIFNSDVKLPEGISKLDPIDTIQSKIPAPEWCK